MHDTTDFIPYILYWYFIDPCREHLYLLMLSLQMSDSSNRAATLELIMACLAQEHFNRLDAYCNINPTTQPWYPDCNEQVQHHTHRHWDAGLHALFLCDISLATLALVTLLHTSLKLRVTGTCMDDIRRNERKRGGLSASLDKNVFKKNKNKKKLWRQWKVNTHKSSAQAEDGGVLVLGVDVSAEKAVAHIARVIEVGVRGVALFRSQVCHCVRGGDEAGVCGQIEMKAFPKRINPVVNP